MAGKTQKALILGVGNILLRDEGLGVRAAELFRKTYSLPRNAACLDGGTSGLGLLSYIRDFDHIIIIDAVLSGGPPGTLIRISGQDAVKRPGHLKTTAHQLGIKELLEIARFEGYSPDVVIIGIVPADITPGLELSGTVGEKLPAAVALVKKELEKAGFKVKKKRAKDA